MLSLSDRILVIYEGEIVGEHGADVTEEEIGLEMLGAASEEDGSVSEGSLLPQKPPGARHAADDASPPGSTCLQRAGGIAVPMITAALAFPIGGLVVLATGHNPFLAYWDIIKGAGLNWLAHPGTQHRAHGAVQLQPDAAPDDDADPDGPRRRLRLPLRAVQHRRQGPVPRRPLRRELGRHLASST